MTEESNPPKPPARKRRWLKRVGYCFLGLFVLLAIFHRPIFFEATRYFVLRAAKQQNLDLDYKMSGSIFSTLTVENLRAKPTEPGPIQRLEVGTLNIQYSLPDLIRKGLPAFLKLLELKDVYVELTPEESLPPEKDAEPQQFKFPALFPDTLNIDNLNLLIHSPTGDTEVAGVYFSLLPDSPGVLKVQTLDIPGVRRWTDITGVTSYHDRNLVLTKLSIGPEIALKKFNLDASELEKNELKIGVEGTFFNAPTNITARITDLNSTSHIDLTAQVSNLVFEPVWQYLNLTVPLQGSLDVLTVSLQGEPLKPASWSGAIKAGLTGLTFEQHPLGDITLTMTMGDKQAHLQFAEIIDKANSLNLSADATLPEKFEDFPRTTAKGRLTFTAEDLATVTRSLPEVITGDLHAITDFELSGGKLSATTSLDSKQLATAQVELAESHITLQAKKDLTIPAEAPPFLSLVTRLEGKITRLRFQDYTADDFALAVTTNDAKVTLEELTLHKAKNSVAIKADYLLPDDLKSWDAQPIKLDLAIHAPELKHFVATNSDVSLKGSLDIQGKAEGENRMFNGDFVITGRDITAQGIPVRAVDGRLEIVENQAHLSQLNIVLNDKNHIEGSGSVQLSEPYPYKGNLDIRLNDLSLFEPVLNTGTNSTSLRGALTVVWSGTGEAGILQHDGYASVDLTKGQFGEQKNISAHLNSSYSSEYINVPDLYVSAGDLGVATFSLFWKDNRLDLSNLSIKQKKLTLLEGSLSIPLHLSQPEDLDTLIPNSEPLHLSLTTKDLNLRTLFLQLGQKTPPVIGTVNLSAKAEGTLDELLAKLEVRANGIQSTAADEFAPANITLDLEVKDDLASLTGEIRQRLIQPLRITGRVPFDIAVIKKKKAIDPQSPVNLHVSLPSSSLSFVSTLVPAIRQSRGTATVDVKLDGTIANPTLGGNATVDLSTLRFTDPSLPPINAFGLRLNFTQDRMVISRCAGGIAGGTFSAGGSISFKQLDNPVFDLRLATRDALALQNDDLSVRISSDLRVQGPLNAGSVSGNIFVTRSRFYKNIDILPIGLPGRPAPQPPAEPTIISFRQPPLRNWKFDIAIRTADPFLIQSNLARGTITMDLKLGGTGLDPWMDGSVRVESLVASLPFSRLSIESGQIFFTRAQPFIPQLDLRGTSTIRDYNITIFITGPVTDPEALFTSDPPLLQADIVSLIATGMTTSELTRDPNALAGRAVVLLFQKLYRSVFQKNQPPPENDSFLSRIQFDIGATDPKTGKQSAAFGIPLSDQIILSGGLDVGGNFRGQLKYLIRFK